MFVGDVCMGEYYMSIGHGPRTLAARVDIFEKVKPLFDSADFVVGNLEAPLCSHAYDMIEPENIVLKANPAHAVQLKNAGFEVMQVANNHTMQHGSKGFDETLNTFQSLGIHAVGLNGKRPVEIRRHGLRLGFLGASDVPDNTYKDQTMYQRLDEDFLQRIEVEANNFDHLIVMLHWGLESSTRPLPYQRELIDRLYAAGVSAVIGSHPHLFYEIEKRDCFVSACSLGNFVFDLCWDDRLLKTGILEIEFSKQQLSSKFWPVTLSANGCIPVLSGDGVVVDQTFVPYDLGEKMDYQQLRKMVYLVRNIHKGFTRLKLKFLIRKLLGVFFSTPSRQLDD